MRRREFDYGKEEVLVGKESSIMRIKFPSRGTKKNIVLLNLLRKGTSMMRRELDYGKGTTMMRRIFDYGKGNSMKRRRVSYYENKVLS